MSRPRVIVRPAVPNDIQSIIEYLALRSPGTARRFARELRHRMALLAVQPTLGAMRPFDHPALAGIRSCRIGRFRNHYIFYRQVDVGIEVIAVLHGAQNLPVLLGDRT